MPSLFLIKQLKLENKPNHQAKILYNIARKEARPV